MPLVEIFLSLTDIITFEEVLKDTKKAPAKKPKFAGGKKNIGKNKKKVVKNAAKKKKKS